MNSGKKQPSISPKPTEPSLIEKVADAVGIKDTNAPHFLTAIQCLLTAKEIEGIKEKQMNRFNELLTKGNLNDSELEELRAFKVLIGMGIL